MRNSGDLDFCSGKALLKVPFCRDKQLGKIPAFYPANDNADSCWFGGYSKPLVQWRCKSKIPSHFQYKTCQSRRLSLMNIRLVIRRSRVRSSPGLQHTFMEIDYEIFPTVISFCWFKKGSCQLQAKECTQELVNLTKRTIASPEKV